MSSAIGFARREHTANERRYIQEEGQEEREGKKTGDCLTAGGRSSVLKGLLENPPVVCGNAWSGLITDRAGPLVLLHQQRSIYIYIQYTWIFIRYYRRDL